MTTATHPVLLVDDEPEILFSLRGLLRQEFEVHTAPSAQEALTILRSHPIHVIMTDQRMPETTGVEFLAKVQEEWPDVVRILFTGYADIKAVIDAINQGQVYRYLTKPWEPNELIKVLHQGCDLYEMNAERRQLLTHLEDYVGESLALLQEPSAGRPGPLAQIGSDLRARLERVLGKKSGRSGG
jgi:DNA-binding NtrC family response regulator